MEFKPPANVPPERLEQLRKRFDDAKAELAKIPFNGVRVNAVEIGGPYSYAKGPSRASLEKVYTCGHLDGRHQPTCMPRIMTDLARRAFRRPVTTREVEKYIALARSAQKEEGSFDEGLAVGIQAILVSPDFLFRLERDRPGTLAAGPRGRLSRSRRTSWRRACRISSGRACPTPSSAARQTPARCATRRSSRSRCGGCSAIRSPRARRAVRRAVAAVPRARVADPRPRQVPRVRGLPPPLDAPRNRALRRDDRPQRPQRARLHQRALLVPERAPGAPLRHPERVGTGVPAGRPDRRRRAAAS